MSAVLRQPEPELDQVDIVPMRRRHVRQVLRIEAQVYPRPWSSTLFLQEIARKSDRYYIVAREAGQVIGYAGLMTTSAEGHVTTIAVDPIYHRRHIGTRLMLALLDESIESGCTAVSLEVRRSNLGAQQMYEGFGFRSVGIRPGYYIETSEDAIVMWAENIRSVAFRERLQGLRSRLDKGDA